MKSFSAHTSHADFTRRFMQNSTGGWLYPFAKTDNFFSSSHALLLQQLPLLTDLRGTQGIIASYSQHGCRQGISLAIVCLSKLTESDCLAPPLLCILGTDYIAS